MDKFNFYEYLSIMLDWWVTITQSLQWVQDKIKNPFFKEKLQEVLVYISSWDPLSKAMKKIPDVFTSSETSIIEAWEKSWTLVESLSGIALEFKKLHDKEPSLNANDPLERRMAECIIYLKEEKRKRLANG